ncbi:malonate decarboxylase holo-ACP synthase [Hafnia paralvei]|uniref:malonate decarboxylase holo-ACP synthase n=1 Tax=Hafnia paralvei TaxID=546367 RepID=UPI003C2C0A45
MLRPHDLIWINNAQALTAEEALPDWVTQQWQISLPLVVRRDLQQGGRIPVGIRGMKRSQRAAGWVDEKSVVRCATPESLVSDPVALLHSSFISLPPVQVLVMLMQTVWPWSWGVTGSCGYALATDIPVMHTDSDLDLVVRCPQRVSPVEFTSLSERLAQVHLPCRTDVQIETPNGGFALAEWLRDGRVMLKTATGPMLTRDPWLRPEDA